MLENECRTAIARYGMLSRGDGVVVGLSGGADSCALLHFLCSLREELSLTLTAVHVNHGIRGEEAARDAAFAERFCRKLDVKFVPYSRDVPALAAEKGIGLELCGREVRYAAFEAEAARCGAKIATAHTLSDSAETVLFHIIRGCGVNGLRGIPPVRSNIIRPLILSERSSVEEYCDRNDIEYVTDSTNLSPDYSRNYIRLRILPLMKELNPSVVAAIGRLSEAARADDEFIGGLAETAAAEFLRGGDSGGLAECPDPVLCRALTSICLAKAGILPEQRHIAAMADCVRRGEGSVNLPGNNLFRVKSKKITLAKSSSLTYGGESFHNWRVDFAPGEIITPYGGKIISTLIDKNKYNNLVFPDGIFDKRVFKNCLDYDKIMSAEFRFRREGDCFSPAGRNCRKSLKKLFNEAKIPPASRERLPLLVSGGEIAWIPGIGASEPFKVTPETQNAVYFEWK